MGFRSASVALALAVATKAASPAGEIAQAVRIHGYAEVHGNFTIGDERVLDPHRTVIGVDADLGKRITFDMEVDFEHSFSEPELEFARLTFPISDAASIVTGAVLMPVGPLNEYHEPPLFLSVERPMLHKEVIPTTWQEVGLGVSLSFLDHSLRVRAFLVSGLDGLAEVGVSNDGSPKYAVSKGIRAMRSKAVEPAIIDAAAVGRIEYAPVPGLNIGTSFYYGGADQSRDVQKQMTVALYEGDVRFRKAGIDLQAQGAYGRIDGTYFSRKPDASGVAFYGVLGECGYHLAGLMPNDLDLVPFVRYERLDNDFRHASESAYGVLTAGLSFLPTPKVAVKADLNAYVHSRSDAYSFADGSTGNTKLVVNIGVGVMY